MGTKIPPASMIEMAAISGMFVEVLVATQDLLKKNPIDWNSLEA